MAITDRIDDALHFDLPEKKERVRLMRFYFNGIPAIYIDVYIYIFCLEYVGTLPKTGLDAEGPKSEMAIIESFGDATSGKTLNHDLQQNRETTSKQHI